MASIQQRAGDTQGAAGTVTLTERRLRLVTAQLGEDIQVTPNGYLIVSAVIARAGVIDWGDGQRELYPPEVVFDARAMELWGAQVVTNDHPPEPVTSENAWLWSSGFIAGGVTQDGDLLRATLVITDAYAIAQIHAGKRELSIGAWVTSKYAPGEDPTYGAFEFAVSAMEPNHVAIVQRGACGPECKLTMHSADSKSRVQLRLAHRSENMSCQECEARIAADAQASNDRIATLESERDAAAARADTAAAELASYRAAESQRVQDRIRLMTDARGVLGADYGADNRARTDLEIMGDVVAARLPAMAEPTRLAIAEDRRAYVEAAYAAAQSVPAPGPSVSDAVGAAAYRGNSERTHRSLDDLRMLSVAAGSGDKAAAAELAAIRNGQRR